MDELSAQKTANRKGLADVTIELQIISKDVNKLISDVDVAYRNLARMQEALIRLDQTCGTIPSAFSTHRHQVADTLEYLCSSMDKQKMWLRNYADRKDIAMNLVFNLVTQQDAANNIEIAKEMKKDSSSMNGIALLTMIFLPGTFTSVRTIPFPVKVWLTSESDNLISPKDRTRRWTVFRRREASIDPGGGYVVVVLGCDNVPAYGGHTSSMGGILLAAGNHGPVGKYNGWEKIEEI